MRRLQLLIYRNNGAVNRNLFLKLSELKIENQHTVALLTSIEYSFWCLAYFNSSPHKECKNRGVQGTAQCQTSWHPHLAWVFETQEHLVNINHHITLISLGDKAYFIVCSLTAICQPSETERSWSLTTRRNMPFKSNVSLTCEKVIRYGTSLKNSTDNLHTVMPLNKCQILSAVSSVEPLHSICPNGSEERWEINP